MTQVRHDVQSSWFVFLQSKMIKSTYSKRRTIPKEGSSREERYQPAHRKMTCRFGLRKQDFHAVHVERLVEPFQCNAPNALQAQLFACAQLRNRVGD